MVDAVDFFDRFPRPVRLERPQRQPRPAWYGPPEVELPVPVGVSLILARTEDVAVAVTGIHAYSEGFEMAIGVRIREENRPQSRSLVTFHGERDSEGRWPDNILLLGVEFADGRLASNLGRSFPAHDGEPDGVVMQPGGGGGGGRSWDFTYWVWPLPPAGPVAIICAWPGRGIPESRAQVDASVIRDASALAVQLWPDYDS